MVWNPQQMASPQQMLPYTAVGGMHPALRMMMMQQQLRNQQQPAPAPAAPPAPTPGPAVAPDAQARIDAIRQRINTPPPAGLAGPGQPSVSLGAPVMPQPPATNAGGLSWRDMIGPLMRQQRGKLGFGPGGTGMMQPQLPGKDRQPMNQPPDYLQLSLAPTTFTDILGGSK